MKKKISNKKRNNFEKDVGYFLILGFILGLISGIIFGNSVVGIWVGIAFGVCTGFMCAVFKNFDELAKKARARR